MSLKIFDTKICYIGNPKPILKIESLEFGNELNFLIGKNGSGKSTFLKALTNYDDEIEVTGVIKLNNKSLDKGNMGLVTQSPSQSINLELSFLENLVLASTKRYNHISFVPQITTASKSKMISFLKTFNNWNVFSELLHTEVAKLSAGQRQVLAILMRVVRFKELLLLDECTASLDFSNTKTIIGILLDLVKKGTIIIFVTHQIEILDIANSKIFKVENGTIKYFSDAKKEILKNHFF